MPSRGKQAVYVATLPDAYRPQRPWDVPPSFSQAELRAKNLTMSEAHGFARAFNKAQLAGGLVDRRWAFVLKHLKSQRHNECTEPAVRLATA